MKIKRFMAKDVRHAMNDVRDTLGPDAVIISNKKIGDSVELVAAMDFDANVFAQEQQRQTSLENADDIGNADHRFSEMKTEIGALRSLLQAQLQRGASKLLQLNHPVLIQLGERLIELGVTEPLVERIVTSLNPQENFTKLWQQCLTGFTKKIPILGAQLIEEGGVVALVGPTGVGKTTTIVKLAARYVKLHGAEQLGLMTMDSYRIAAHDQLATYGKILGVPVNLVQNSDDLSAMLHKLRHKRLILIDTAGMSQRDPKINEQLQQLQQADREIKTCLVLASNIQTQALNEIIQRYRTTELSGCILTKLDESGALGEVISKVILQNLAIAYVTQGQRVPEDIQVATSESLVILLQQEITQSHLSTQGASDAVR